MYGLLLGLDSLTGAPITYGKIYPPLPYIYRNHVHVEDNFFENMVYLWINILMELKSNETQQSPHNDSNDPKL